MATITVKQKVRNARSVGWKQSLSTGNVYWWDVENDKPYTTLYATGENAQTAIYYVDAFFDFDTLPKQVANANLVLRITRSYFAPLPMSLYKLTENITGAIPNGKEYNTTKIQDITWTEEEYYNESIISVTREQNIFCVKIKRLPVQYSEMDKHYNVYAGDFTNNQEEVIEGTYLEYDVTECNITGLACTQSNIDAGLTFTWDSEYQTSVDVKIYQGTTLKAIKTVTTAKTATFPVGAIRESGNYTVKLTGCDGVTVEETFTFTKTIPSVSNLEPDGLSKDGREIIGISWTSSDQTSYICNVGGNTYTGTTATNIVLPAGTLSYGTNNIHLTVRYTTAWGEIREATTTASFIVYGPPAQPNITSSGIFSTGTPTFTWTSEGQTAYKLTVKQGISVIFTTNEVIGTNKYFVTTTALENSEEYQVYLQVKNKYNIWSEEAVQDIAIQFDIPAKPGLNVFQGDNAIVLNISNATTPTNYKYSEIYRRDSLSDEFTRIALNLPENGAYYDYFVAHDMEYEYFARNYNQAGGYNDSDSIIITAKVQGYGLYDIENSSNKIVFYNDVNISDDFKRDIELFNMATSKAPYSERGINDYLACKVTYKTSKLSDFYLLQKLEKTSKVLMYKDKQGRKMPCNITSNISRSIDKFGFITVSFTLTEVQFKECDYVDGGNEGRTLLLWNGTWQFDGTHSLRGE